jgi:acetyl esterase/lipase
MILAATSVMITFFPAASSGLPQDVVEGIKAIGPVIDAIATAKLFAPLHPAEPYPSVAVIRDEKYGPNARNRLDVFSPSEPGSGRPVLIFLHGGGYTRGDKKPAKDAPFYDNVAFWAVRNNMVGITMTYRLAPDKQWPAGAEDVGAAVAWAKENITRFGGDPGRIFLLGHSAGGTHVAGYIAARDLHKIPDGGIAGAILLSGTYRLLAPSANAGERAYFGEDPGTIEMRSPLPDLARSTVPLLVAYGEIDVPTYATQAELLRNALCAENRCPSFAMLPGHSHMSEVYSINTSDTTLTDQVLKFMRSVQQ